MRVQIYTMQTPDEALQVINAGAHHIGITPSQRGLPGEVSFETARAIVDAVGDKALRIALTVESDPALIIEMARAVQPDMLHLCPLRGAFSPDHVAALRVELPGIKIMQAIEVGGADTREQAINDARAYEAVADMLILDTQAPEIAGIGASGKTHDWTISREIVESVRIPVILAGGLSLFNVGAAIRAVRPYGVDSLTHTNEKLAGGGFRKDILKVQRFAGAVRAAAKALES